MKLLRVLIPLNVVLVSLVAVATLPAKSEQPSTVFVLDTSDSDPAPEASNDSNARIVSDETGSLKQDHNQRHAIAASNAAPPSTTTTTTTTTTNSHHQQRDKHASTSAQDHQDHNQVVSGRRLDEPTHMAPAHKVITQQQPQQQQQQNNQKQHKSTTTTTTLRNYDSDHNSSAPKTEERLLISITNEDNEDAYKKVSTGNGANGHSSFEEPQSLGSAAGSQQVHHHQKRKPSITISIQDANINKQTGSSGTQAVIVRPGDDGQSIVIATVGTPQSATNTNNSNKYKPSQTNGNDNINIPVAHVSSNPQRPYNEPINNPIQGIIAQHQITSTTRRPLVNDYNPHGSSLPSHQNRPITSTLVDRPPPNQVTDERPQRPIQSGLDDRPISLYETPRPNSPIVRPPSEAYSGGNTNGGSSSLGNQDIEPSTSNEPYPSSSQSNDDSQPQRKFPLNEKNCGVMHETRIVGGDEADPDDFMWMAAIIKSKPNNGEPRPFCGGSLITRRHILTAAHCLEGLAPRDVLVRLGSYDFEDSASSSSADYAIDQFRVPAQYSKKTHVADLAIMRLKTPLATNDLYKTVCMPQPRRSYVGAFGLVTGYGSQSQTFRKAAPKLRQVTVPIWENRKCSKVYNKTMGDSFLCAGYEEGGKDACQGDSGGPIMTEGPDQKMMIVGVVSHGIGCGSPGYPGVYTRTTTFADWIEKNTRE